MKDPVDTKLKAEIDEIMKILREILKRLRLSITYRLLSSNRFKSLFIQHIRNCRLHYPEHRNGSGADFTFLEYSHSASPPPPYLHDILNGAVHLLDEEWRMNSGFIALSPQLKPLYDYNSHYLLLTAIARVLEAKRIVEIGTGSGMSLWAWLRSDKMETVSTWDILPLKENTSWFQNNEIKKLVEDSMLNDLRWTQYVEDLLDPEVWSSRVQLFLDADIIFIDGPHDGIFEKKAVNNILELRNESNILIIFDDIWVSSLVDVWRDLPLPKLDATSVGHQSGTGLAMLPPRLERETKP